MSDDRALDQYAMYHKPCPVLFGKPCQPSPTLRRNGHAVCMICGHPTTEPLKYTLQQFIDAGHQHFDRIWALADGSANDPDTETLGIFFYRTDQDLVRVYEHLKQNLDPILVSDRVRQIMGEAADHILEQDSFERDDLIAHIAVAIERALAHHDH